jgi:hypothetical protein
MSQDIVTLAVTEAIRFGTIGFSAVRLICPLQNRRERTLH